MYKILVFSDTHSRTEKCEQILHANPDTNMVLHAGDTVCDALNLSYIFTDISFKIVSGNNDIFSSEKDEILFDVCGIKIFLTHGHAYGVKHSVSSLVRRAKSLNAQLVVFGHTHKAYLGKSNGIYLLNPGAAGALSDASYATVIIKDGILTADICKF